MNNNLYNFSIVASLVFKHGIKLIYEHKKGFSQEELYKNGYTFSKEVLEHFKINVKVYGLENLVGGPAIMCPSHTSVIDPLAIVCGVPGRKYFGAKKELYKIPFFGSCLKAAEMPKIDRSNKVLAIKSLNDAAGMIKSESYGREKENTAYLVIYPEGTRTTDPDYKLLPFKKGAFNLSVDSNLPIIPVSSFGGKAIISKGSLKLLKEKERDYYLMVHPPIFPEIFFNEKCGEEGRKKAIENLLVRTRNEIETGIRILKNMG